MEEIFQIQPPCVFAGQRAALWGGSHFVHWEIMERLRGEREDDC